MITLSQWSGTEGDESCHSICFSFLFSLRPHPMGQCHLYPCWVFMTSSSRYTHRGVSKTELKIKDFLYLGDLSEYANRRIYIIAVKCKGSYTKLLYHGSLILIQSISYGRDMRTHFQNTFSIIGRMSLQVGKFEIGLSNTSQDHISLRMYCHRIIQVTIFHFAV